MSAGMQVALTLPGSIPGLLRRGSPIVLPDGCLGVLAARHDGWFAAVQPFPGSELRPAITWAAQDSSDFALDLTDATGRAHAAWWLAKAVDARWSPCALAGSWKLTHLSGERLQAQEMTTFGGKEGCAWMVVSSLADLDPNDPRLLPDGSRWVDAEALRRVCLHVAGLEVA